MVLGNSTLERSVTYRSRHSPVAANGKNGFTNGGSYNIHLVNIYVGFV
jgi:hypothetical protein